MSRKRCRTRAILAASVTLACAHRVALAGPFTVSYTDGGSWNTLYAQGFSPALAPNPNPGLAAGDTVLLDQFQFFKSGTADSAADIRLVILNNIYANLQGLTTSSASVVGLSNNTIASTAGISTGEAITFDFDNLALTYGGQYGAVFVNVGAAGELTPVLVSALHTDYVDVGGGDYHPGSNYGSESDYQFTTSNFITTNEFGQFFNAFSYAGDANFVASLLTPTVGSSWSATGSGTWSAPENWTDGVPNAVGAAATFGTAANAAATVTVDANVTVGSITFDNTHGYTVAGTNTLTLDTSGGTAAINVASGNHRIDVPVVLTKNTAITVTPASSTLTLSALASSPAGVTKEGAGTLAVNNIRASSLVINGGTVALLPDAMSAGTSNVGSLTIAQEARLDLKRNKLVTSTEVGTWDGTKYTGVQGEVARAYDFGAWDLPGIMTSEADAGPAVGKATIGVSTGEQALFLAPTETGVFSGQTISGATTIAMCTWAGDVDLNGYVDAVDYGTIDQWIQFPGTTGYTNGDLNYDGVIDAVDYGIIDNGIQLQGLPIPTGATAHALATVTPVPEPAACGAAVLAAAGLLARWRRG